ncbi:MAG: antitoxin [Bdellovibrionales bacterium GWA2_49_15]|nr:MAG: antitoxin [Bdellovibrionales bacterium GWA2_49_15]HAZ11606.1 antitoxin [Bdellovibrionales bacterium]
MKKEYNFSKMKGVKNPYASKKKAVGINLSTEVIEYFKGLSKESGIAYQILIDLYLRDCVETKKKISIKWEQTT